MLEEELVVRRSFWRRQRQKERELILKEYQFIQQFFFDLDFVIFRDVQRFLEEIDVDVYQFSEVEKREVQRRGGVEQEYVTVISLEVIAVLIQSDVKEYEGEEGYVVFYVKLVDVLRRFFNKL